MKLSSAVSILTIKQSHSRTYKIALYVAISSDREQLSRALTLKRRIKQGASIGSAYLSKKPKFDFNSWEVPNSNKGDILIREAVKQQLTKALPHHVSFMEIHWGDLDNSTAKRINAECDAFVIAGSGYIFPSFGILPPRFLADAKAIAKITCPKVALGIGLNILEGEEASLCTDSLAALQSLIGDLDLISVRDEKTAAMLTQITRRACLITGDPVLFYDYETLGKIRSTTPYSIGLNLALHGPISANNISRDIDKMADLLKRLQLKFPVSFHYIAHAPSERLAWWMLKSRGLNMPWYDLKPAALPKLYATLDAHICQMMHSAICAMNRDVPVTAFAYDRKTNGLFDLMRLPQYCVSMGNWSTDSVFPILERMIQERGKIRAHIQEARERLLNEGAEFSQAFRSLLERRQISP